jgi:hypothetical protein
MSISTKVKRGPKKSIYENLNLTRTLSKARFGLDVIVASTGDFPGILTPM